MASIIKPFNIGETRPLFPLRTRMKKAATGRTITQICRVSQVISAVIILAVSIRLTQRWSELRRLCGGEKGTECEKIAVGLGGIKFCITVGAWALFDTALWLVDTYWYSVPWFVVYGSAQLCAGLSLGGGCTLAALINGWNCKSGAQGGRRLCDEYYTNIAFLFAQVLVSWIGVAGWCYMKKYHQPDNFSRMS